MYNNSTAPAATPETIVENYNTMNEGSDMHVNKS